jgi:uncharacterized membrane protein
MEGFIALGVLVLIGAFALFVFVVIESFRLRSRVADLKRRVAQLETQKESQPAAAPEAKRATPPPLPAFLQPPPPAPKPSPTPKPPEKQALPPVNWESILGVKLFAWIGGLALFLGVVFFVKYAFENNWITPAMRIVAGAITGIALVAVGLIPALRQYRVPAQSLCVTGILILYADVYAAHAFYQLIPLSVATVLMWAVTALALGLATYISAHSVAVLSIIGGFLTPELFWKGQNNSIQAFGYVAVLNFAIAAVGALKRWNYLILLAAIGSVIAEFVWMPTDHGTARNVFLAIEAQFVAICFAVRYARLRDDFATGAALLTTFTVFVLCFLTENFGHNYDPFFVFPILLLANCGVIALVIADRSTDLTKEKAFAAIGACALGLTWLVEWDWYQRIFSNSQPLLAIAWYVAIFLLFAGVPYFGGTKRVWAWIVGAAAGPLQFWYVYQFVHLRFPSNWEWLLPLAFALPAAGGVFYLFRIEYVDLASGDTRLASQGAAVLAFVSLVFPVQFHREWITLGWAIEGLGLILLFRLVPNRRLRAVALIVLAAAFARLALNPAVFDYHPRAQVPIWNWYLCAYGVAALCFFLGGHWFGESREKQYEQIGPPLLYSFSGIALFLLMNIEIADYFSIGPTLTFSFSGNFARDMTYTVAWALFAFGLLVLGIRRNLRPVRLVAIALLGVAFAKLFLHDLDSLNQLYRIGAFVTVAIIAIIASFVYQRFLSSKAKPT